MGSALKQWFRAVPIPHDGTPYTAGNCFPLPGKIRKIVTKKGISEPSWNDFIQSWHWGFENGSTLSFLLRNGVSMDAFG